MTKYSREENAENEKRNQNSPEFPWRNQDQKSHRGGAVDGTARRRTVDGGRWSGSGRFGLRGDGENPVRPAAKNRKELAAPGRRTVGVRAAREGTHSAVDELRCGVHGGTFSPCRERKLERERHSGRERERERERCGEFRALK